MKKFFFIFLILKFTSFAQFSTKWDPIYSGLYFKDIVKLNTDTLLAATGNGAYISTNFGNDWIQKSNQQLSGLVTDTSHRIFGFYDQYVFVSEDGGINWTLVNFVLTQGYIIELNVDKNNNLWILTGNPSKLFKSTDSGLNWNLMYSSSNEITDIDFDGMNNIYLITYNECFRSTDGGINWIIFFETQMFHEMRRIEINPNDEIYIASSQEIYSTKDYGVNWKTLSGIQCDMIKSIDKNNTVIVLDRMYKSSDGGNYWFNMGMNISDPFMINIYNIDSVIFAAYYDSLFIYDPNGQPPLNIVKDNYIPLSVGNKWLYKGGNWSPPYSSNYIIYNEATNEQIIGGRRYVYVTGQGWMSYSDEDKVFYYYENGNEFAPMDFKLPDNTLFPVKSPQNQDELFYNKTHSGYVYQTNIQTKGYSFPYFEGTISNSFAENLGYYSYSDNSYLYGNTSHYLIQALIKDSSGNFQLYDYPYDPEIIFTPITKTSDSLLTFTLTVDHHYSVDSSEYNPQGLNFIDTVSMAGFYVSAVDTLSFNTVYGENIFGTKKFEFNVPIDISLLRSNYKLNYRMTAKDKGIVPHLDDRPSDNTYFQMIFDTTVSVDNQTDQLLTFQLFQNYPNPFNPDTKIKFETPNAGFVTLKIYDVLGAEVAILVNEEKSRGRYEVNFNASSLASGVYIYRLQTGKFVELKKMILLK